MSISFQVHSEQHRVEVLINGYETMANCMQAIIDVNKNPDHQPNFHVLVDLRELKLNPSTRDMRLLAETLKAEQALYQGRIAVVLGSLFHYGMTRMAAAFAVEQGINMQPFMQMDEALAWLASD